MENEKIPLRSEVPEAETWDLRDLYPTDEAWLKEYEDLKTLPERAAAFQGKLGRSAEDLLLWFRLQDEIQERLSRLHTYASCKSDQDTGNGTYQDFRGKAMGTYVAVLSACAFATPEIMAIDDDTLNLFYAAQPELLGYQRSLYQIRRRKAHILSPECEKLLAAAGEMADSPDRISSTFRDADLTFPPVVDSEGRERTLTDATYIPMLMGSDRALRKTAFETYYGRMNECKNTFAATLDAQFKSLKFFADARGYESTLAASLDATEVPTEVYHNLISAVHDNLDKMYRYVALRKKRLGVDELHMYDVYTPIVADADSVIPYETAKETVLEALAVLGKDYTDLLREGFDHRWIDVRENVGKRGGAYSTGSGKPHPYVLLNHKDNLDCQFTLAHEMGHALHSYHSVTHQPTATSD